MARFLKILSLATALLVAPNSRAASLWDVYQLARQNDPQLREADANRMALRESKPQAFGALLPQIGTSADWGQNAITTSRAGVSFTGTETTTGVTDAHSRSDQTDWSVQLRQTLFRWDQWVRFRQADKQALQADVDYRVAEIDLYTRVADGYFNVLAADDTLAAVVAAREAIGRQLEQAQKRFEVGLIAITDVQEAQSGYDQAIAAEILAKRQLANSKEVLREIIGDYPGELAKPRTEIPLVSPEPADEGQWVELALQQNLSLQSAQIGADIARDNISIARSGHLPTIDFVASYTGNKQRGNQDAVFTPNGQASRPVTISATDFDTDTNDWALQVTLPIFSGGVTHSKVQQAVYQHRASKEKLERIARQTERATRDAYLAVNSEISHVQALQQALKSSQTALQATEAGYEVGTRTTVDVLAGRQQLYQAETNYARSRYDYIVNVLKLKEAAGTLNDKDVEDVNSWLEPAPPAPASAPTPEPAPKAE
jgi:outer membrane protein